MENSKASSSEIVAALTERELVPPEKALDTDTVALVQQRIQDAQRASSQIGGDA